MNKKYKKIPLVLMGLAGVALLTSGFSTWVISTQATETVSNINITTGEVNDNRLKAVIVPISGDTIDGSVSFDANGNSGTLIKGADTTNHEDLSFGAKIQIGFAKNYKGSSWTTIADSSEGFTLNTAKTYFTKLKFNFIAADTGTDKYSKYLSENSATVNSDVNNSILGFDLFKKSNETTYVGEDITISLADLTSTTSNAIKATRDKSTQDKYIVSLSALTGSTSGSINYIEYQFIFKFGWGSFFNYKNPTNFSNETELPNAIRRLQGLRSDVNNLKFNVTVSTVA